MITEYDVKVSEDIKGAQWYRYRVRGSGDLVNKLVLNTVHGEFTLRDKALRRFISYLGLKYSDMIRIIDWKERNRVLRNAIKGYDKILVLSANEKNNVVRVVTDDFIAIPHSLITESVRNALGNAGILFEEDIHYNGGMFATWTLQLKDKAQAQKGEKVAYRIWAYNKNDGSHSFRMGTGALILVCSNGLIRYSTEAKITIVHKSELDKVEKAIYEIVDKLIVGIDEIDALIEDAQHTVVYKKQVLRYIKNLHIPIWIKDEIKRTPEIQHIIKYGKGTLWSVSQALTWVATHTEEVTQNYRFYLSRTGGRVLEDKKVIAELMGVSQ